MQIYIYINIYVRGWELWGAYSSDTLHQSFSAMRPRCVILHGGKFLSQVHLRQPTMETPFPKTFT